MTQHASRAAVFLTFFFCAWGLNAAPDWDNPYSYQPAWAKDPGHRAALETEAPGLAEFLAKSGEPVEAVIVELDGQPAMATWMKEGASAKRAVGDHRHALLERQSRFIDTARLQGIELLPRSKPAADGKGKHHIHYRFSLLLNGFVAYVRSSDLPRLRALPGVKNVSIPLQPELRLDNSVNHMLGSNFDIADRRLAVYGANEELDPVMGAAAESAIDGFEGQGVVLGVIDSGMDYEHPMLGGSGAATPLPQRPPLTETTANGKVIYWYNLGGATTLDDHGHGTHVSSTAGGFRADGSTSGVLMTGALLPVGPTPAGVTLHGVAPQVKLMGWPVCAATGSCPGDIELAVEDSVSPTVLTGIGDGNSIDTGVAKPIADVVNLSLGGGSDPASASSRTVNNASLAGVLIAAAAGNDGPGGSTLGAPCVATGAICVGSVLDPGSTAGTDVLAAGEITGDLCADTNGGCLVAAPPAETGAASNANAPDAGEQQGMTTFHMSGGGPLPDGSVSAHYVYVDRSQADVPGSVMGRIALLENGTGTFFQIVNPVAVLNPEAILLITDTQSATAVAVVNDVPVFTFGTADGAYLKSILLSGGGDPAHGAVSQQPIRVKAAVDIDAFVGSISGFSSRGPNSNVNAQFRTVKPDVVALGSGVLAATTPSGNPDVALGMMNPTGYTTANGTSMATPHASGALALVRQRLRGLGYDSADLNDPDYFDKRFRAATLARALVTNYATDLRTGRGGDDPNAPNPPYTIHDVGGGFIDVRASLEGHAVMTSLTRMFEEDPNEFNSPGFGELPDSVEVDANGNVLVPLPTASFGNVEVLGINTIVHRFRKVTIEDIDGSGGGTYDLAVVDDVLATHPAVEIELVAGDLSTTIDSIDVPANGEASFFVWVRVDGSGALANGTLISWYVSATHTVNQQRLRMPFLYRAVEVDRFNALAPENLAITDTEQPTNVDGCEVDDNNIYTLSWSAPSTGEMPTGYVVERGTVFDEVFFDDASEPLVAGANSLWEGSEQWESSVDPNSSDEAYFIANAVEQNEVLTMSAPIDLSGATRAGLELLTTVDTEQDFDFAIVEGNANGGAFQELARYTGASDGLRNIELSTFAGTMMKLQFRMSSDLLLSSVGWWVDDVRVISHDLNRIVELSAATTSISESAPASGTFYYRVAGLFDQDGTEVIGPFTQPVCVATTLPPGTPEPKDDVFDTDEDTGLAGNVLADNGNGADSDPDMDSLTVTNAGDFTAAGIGGAVSLMANGDFTYDPPLNAFGTATFSYTITDGNSSASATVTITVNPVDDPPTARDDAFQSAEDQALNGNVLVDNGNGADSDPEGDSLSVSSTGSLTVGGIGGSVNMASTGEFTYMPPADASGVATFDYTVTEGDLNDTATVTITVQPVNDPPTAQDDAFTSSEDATVNGNLLVNNGSGADFDVDADPLEVVSTGTQIPSGLGGTVTVMADGDFSYTPPANASGTATFNYTITDGELIDSATVTLTVIAVNDPPTFTAGPDQLFFTPEAGDHVVEDWATNISPGPDDEQDQAVQFEVSIAADPEGILSAVDVAADGTLSYTLTGNGGTAQVQIVARDDGGTSGGGDDASDPVILVIGTDLIFRDSYEE